MREERGIQPLVVRMPLDLHQAVKERAQEDDLTMAQLVRHAVRDYLDQGRLAPA
jgi:hypothetical protein